MVYGLVAALGWGVSAVAATNAARRAGTYLAVLCGQGVGVVLLIMLALLLQPSFAAAGGAVALSLAGAGLLGLLGYLAFYRALEYGGAVGLVSAISATYGGVTTVLAVTVLGEHLGATGAAGVVLAIAGIALAAARPAAAMADGAGSDGAGAHGAPATVAVGEPIVGVAPAPSRIRSLSRAGVPLAIVCALAYGVGGFVLGKYSARAGWLTAALVAHGASVTVMLMALPLLRRKMAWRGTASGVVWAAAAGLTDAVGLLAFSQGGHAGEVAVTAAVSSVYPVIPLVGGVLLFGEHLTRRQLVGVVGIIAGLVLIGLG
ncbi:MAG TPA: DMT family transporter [Streptosporangiaceae bacterium]|nr:DMT family transporter [Streptosporangiaceae bacterium]